MIKAVATVISLILRVKALSGELDECIIFLNLNPISNGVCGMSKECLLFETKYGAMTGYEVFVKYCETRDWELMDEVLHDDYMCIDELAVLNKEEMRQRSIDDKKRGFELFDGKEIFDSEDALIFSHPMKGDWGAYTAGEKYDEIIHVCLKKDKKVWREMIKIKKAE